MFAMLSGFTQKSDHTNKTSIGRTRQNEVCKICVSCRWNLWASRYFPFVYCRGKDVRRLSACDESPGILLQLYRSYDCLASPFPLYLAQPFAYETRDDCLSARKALPRADIYGPCTERTFSANVDPVDAHRSFAWSPFRHFIHEDERSRTLLKDIVKAKRSWPPGVRSPRTEYFDPSIKDGMLSYRDESLETLLDVLRKDGATIVGTIEKYDYGNSGGYSIRKEIGSIAGGRSIRRS